MSRIRYAPNQVTLTGAGAATLERAEPAPRIPQWQEGAGPGSFVAHPARPEMVPTRPAIEPGTNSSVGQREDALPSVVMCICAIALLGIVAAHHPTRDMHPGEWYGPAETRPVSAPAGR